MERSTVLKRASIGDNIALYEYFVDIMNGELIYIGYAPGLATLRGPFHKQYTCKNSI